MMMINRQCDNDDVITIVIFCYLMLFCYHVHGLDADFVEERLSPYPMMGCRHDACIIFIMMMMVMMMMLMILMTIMLLLL
jgi:hypothetical protein